MPTAVDGLTKDSSDEAVKAAISECIAAEMDAGAEQEEAVAMCYEMARRKTGKELPPK